MPRRSPPRAAGQLPSRQPMTQNANVELNGRQVEMLADGLLAAFTGFNDLARVVMVALDEWLHEIVDQRATFTDQVWQLVRWADARGKTRDLFRVAVENVPGNAQLRQAVEAVWGGAAFRESP